MNLKLGKAMGNSLDEKAYTKMITCINPQKSSEEMSKCVLKYSSNFQKNIKKAQLPTEFQLVNKEHQEIKEMVYILIFNNRNHFFNIS